MTTWRDELSDPQRRKIALPLQQWLDGASIEELDLPSREPGRVKIWARVLEELAPERVEEFVALGLEAEEDMLAIPGSIDRQQLVGIAKHPDIVGINPVQRVEYYPTDQGGSFS